jgi:hypothetical protein
MLTLSNFAAFLAASFAITGVVSVPTALKKTHGTPSSSFTSSIKKKYNGTVASGEAKRGLRKRDDFGAAIEASWLVVLDVGTPGTEVELSLDLGSELVKLPFDI